MTERTKRTAVANKQCANEPDDEAEAEAEEAKHVVEMKNCKMVHEGRTPETTGKSPKTRQEKKAGRKRCIDERGARRRRRRRR